MKKIPTIFERDWDGDRSRVLEKPTPGCEWVFAGEGVATRKYDGTCVAVMDGLYVKRHEVREGKPVPEGFLGVQDDSGKMIGWLVVGDGPEDKWHREALNTAGGIGALEEGTYELVGPKVQGNREKYAEHTLIRHSHAEPYIVSRTYEGMRELLAELDIEGFVFHHPDGRMAKIKKRDFGLRRVEP